MEENLEPVTELPPADPALPRIDPQTDRRTEVAQAAGVIALGNVASRAVGLVREVVKSGLFGATGSVSAFEAAVRVPTIIYDLLVGGMVNSALIPILSEYAIPQRRAELWQIVSVLLSLVLVVLSGVVVVGELLARPIVWLLAPGLDAAFQAEAVTILRIVLPAIVFLNLAGVLSGTLYALQRFSYPAFTATVYNLAVVVLALALGRRMGVASMALGLLVGSALQVALQLPGLRGAKLRFCLDFRHPVLRSVGRLYVPIAVGLIIDMLAVLLSYNLASRTGDPSISWMQYAATLIQFPLGLVVTAVSVAILPTLSRQAAEQQVEPFKVTLAQGLKLVLWLIVPATIGLYILAVPLVRLVFEHGDFTPADTAATAQALRCALVGLPFAAIDQPLIFAFYARKDTLTPALVGVVGVVFYVGLTLVPAWLGFLTLPWLVFANSLKWAAHALIMLALFRRRGGGVGNQGVWTLLLKALASGALMGGLVWIAMRGLLAWSPAGLVGEALVVIGAGAVGLCVYVGLARVLHVEESALLLSALRRRLGGPS